MIEVQLSNLEMMIAAHVGATRSVASLNYNKEKQSDKSQFVIDVDGAAAEMAVAKHFNIYWVPTVNAGKAADVMHYQVRQTQHDNGRLLVREKDKKEEKYILVTGVMNTFRIRGWMWLSEAKQEKYYEHKSGLPAWWVPQSDLHPMETING